MSSWFYVEDQPPYGADVDNNRCEYSIFMRPGFHTGLSYIHGGFLKAVIWTKMSASSERKPTTIQVPLQPNNWYHFAMSVNDVEQSLSLYVNGVKVGERDYSGDLIQYMNKPYYIGVGDYGSSSWRNFFKGQIAEVCLWSESLEDYEVGLVFEKGVTKNGEFSVSKIPKGYWDFSAGYSNTTFDRSGNNNHALKPTGPGVSQYSEDTWQTDFSENIVNIDWYRKGENSTIYVIATDNGTVSSYDYSLGTTAGSDDIISWFNSDTNYTSIDLSALSENIQYFSNARVIDAVGNISDVVSSNGFIAIKSVLKPIFSAFAIDSSVVPVSEHFFLKSLNDGSFS